MKISKKRVLQVSLSVGVLASAGLLAGCANSSGSASSSAGNKLDYKVTAPISADYAKVNSKNAPISSYWFPDEFLKWSADTDKDLIYNKSTVALTKRIDLDKLTPSNEAQNKKTKIVALSNMNPSTSGNPSRGTNQFDSYVFDYWQYVDTLVYWGGSAGEGTIVTPSADVIDDAHLNGVPVLGTIFCPPTVYGGKLDWMKEIIQQDANGDFPFAKKMVEVAKAYNFDGWFINQETEGLNADEATKMKDLVAQVKKLDPSLQVMWYDSMTKDGKVDWQNQLNDENAQFISDNGQKIADSMFLNFDWNQAASTPNLLQNSAEYAEKIKVDPYDIYAGIDVEAGGGASTRVNWSLLESGKNSTYTSIGLYAPSTTYSAASNFEDFQNQETAFWVNAAGDPRKVGTSTNYSWIGLSKYAVEKSSIQGTDFSTNFNLGNGYNWFKDGEMISQRNWSNRSMAQTLPTYRWIFDNEGENKLTPSVDYSKAYNGGNSFKFMANMQANKASTMTLFATELKATADTKFDVAMRSDSPLNVSAVLTLSDGSTQTIKGDAQAKDSWGLISFDTKALEGKTVTKIALKLESDQDISGNAINLGGLTFSDQKKSDSTSISDLKVTDQAFENESMLGGFRLEWQSAAPEAADHYEIYQVVDGKDEFLGASNIPAFFINALERGKNQNESEFKVVPVNKVGQLGQGDTVSVTWPDNTIPKAAFSSDATVIAPGDSVQFKNDSNMASTKFKWEFEGGNISTSTEREPKVTYAKEGTYKVTLTAYNDKGDENTVTQTDYITVTEDAKAGLDNFALNKKVTVDTFTNDNEAGPNAVDGKTNTKWCAVGPTAHTLEVDLGATQKINAIKLINAEAGGEAPGMNTRAYTVAVSTDGKTWTDVVKVTNNAAAEVTNAFKQTEARYVKLTVDKPTQADDTAARIYEFEVLGLKV